MFTGGWYEFNDTNSTNRNSNLTTTNSNSIYSDEAWEKAKAGVNGDPSEPRYELGTTIYVDIKGTEYKGTVVGWDPIELLYKIKYENGYTGEMFHNEVKLYHHSTVKRLPKERRYKKPIKRKKGRQGLGQPST